MAIYDELLGDVLAPDRMAQAARKLRRQEAFGALGAMSGDPYLGPWGQGVLNRAPQQGGRLSQARQAAQNLQQREEEYGGLEQWRQTQARQAGERMDLDQRRLEGTTLTPAPGMTYQPYAPEGQQWGEAPGWQEREEAKRAHELAKKRAGGEAAMRLFMGQQGFKESKMSDSMEKEWRENQGTIFKGRAMLEQAKDVAAKGGAFVEPIADLPSRALGSMGLESLAEMAAGAHKTPEEMATRANMSDWLADMRKSRMGTAVSVYEGSKGTPWDPTVGGITQEVSLQRWEDLVQAMEYAAAVMAYGKRIPGVKDDPTALPPKPVGMTDEEFVKFQEDLQRMMSYGGGFTSGTAPATPAPTPTPAPALAPAAPMAPASPVEGFRFE